MKQTPPIPFAGSQLSEARHVCAFFNNPDEEYRVLLPFIKDGLDSGHRAVHILSPCRCVDHVHRLAAAGIDANAAESSGQLQMRTNRDFYFQDGKFDQARMFEVFEKLSGETAEGQYPLSRIICQMDWVTDSRSQFDHVVEFESRVNEIWNQRDDAVICVYDLAKLGGDMVIDIIRTHPMVIIGNMLQTNPFYMPPEMFLADIRKRRASDSGSTAT